MISHHHLLHYASSAILLGLCIGTITGHNARLAKVESLAQRAMTHSQATSTGPMSSTVRKLRSAWPGLGQDSTIELAEGLANLKLDAAPVIVIYCANADCTDLAADIDDALQVVGWGSSFERRPVDAEGELGISVGPRALPEARGIAMVLSRVLGQNVSLVDADINSVGIFVGKKP